MSDFPFRTYGALRDEIGRLHAHGAYGAGGNLAQRAAAHFPQHESEILFWQMCFNTINGETSAALAAFKTALDKGHWYDQTWLRRDSDLAALQGQPDFEALVARSLEQRMAALVSAQPSRIDRALPDAPQPYPLLLALHGNNGAAGHAIDHWDAARAQGWYLSAPHSTQLASSATAVWNDDGQTRSEIQQHHHEISASSPIDPARVVLGGFSKGAAQALRLALQADIPATGVIALGPALGKDLDPWLALVAAAPSHLRVALLVGDRDNPPHIYEPTLALADALTARDIATRLSVYPEMGHRIPPDFNAVLPDLLAWISGG